VQRLIGALFAVGSVLFLVPGLAALGSSAEAIAWGFALGAVFFTAAAALQLATARARLDVLAAAVQLPGTILFNVNTLDALDRALDAAQADVRVWTPDMIGSACFLVASAVACHAVGWGWRPRERDWQIAAANLFGAAAFGVSAIAAYVRPDDAPLSDTVANAATAAGAAGFLVGAILLRRS
jgi:hypothetical protein